MHEVEENPARATLPATSAKCFSIVTAYTIIHKKKISLNKKSSFAKVTE